MRIILSGPPASGKGTQAKAVAAELGIPHISTGDMLRREISKGTDLGREFDSLISTGNFVPDEMMIPVVEKRLSEADCQSGFVLDGYPRTIRQNNFLKIFLKGMGVSIDHVIHMEVPAKVCIERVTGRRTCSNSSCGLIYHVTLFPPLNSEGRCDKCGDELTQRADDSTGVVLDRLELYCIETAPIAAFYWLDGILQRVESKGSPEEVTAQIMAILSKPLHGS